MTQRPLRFLHAGDLALHQPVGGLAEIPDSLVDLFWQAPYRAAERLVDTALAEAVDFVLLCGEQVLPERSGPRGPLALCEQFERLRQQGIAVYWAGAPTWPSAYTLPDNVYRFPASRLAEVYHRREQQPVARIVGGRLVAEQGGAMWLSPSPLFTAAVWPGMPAGSLLHGAVDYWACGGAESATPAEHLPAVTANRGGGAPGSLPAGGMETAAAATHNPAAYCAGPLQGRSPQQVGPHGCWLVNVAESSREAMAAFVPCDVLRWQQIRVVLDAPVAQAELARLVELRVGEAQAACKLPLVYTVILAGAGVSRGQRSEAGRQELAALLRRQAAQADPPQWCGGVEVEPDPAALARALQEETLLGEYLRAAWALLERGDEPGSEVLNVAADLPQQAQSLAGLVAPADRARRAHLLREAAKLGLSLLTAEEPLA